VSVDIPSQQRAEAPIRNQRHGGVVVLAAVLRLCILCILYIEELYCHAAQGEWLRRQVFFNGKAARLGRRFDAPPGLEGIRGGLSIPRAEIDGIHTYGRVG